MLIVRKNLNSTKNHFFLKEAPFIFFLYADIFSFCSQMLNALHAINTPTLSFMPINHVSTKQLSSRSYISTTSIYVNRYNCVYDAILNYLEIFLKISGSKTNIVYTNSSLKLENVLHTAIRTFFEMMCYSEGITESFR